MRNILIIIFIPLLFFSSSCKKCSVEDCTGYETITLQYIHYLEEEADSILIKRYKLHSNFTEPIDSIIAQNYYYSGDTMNVQFIDRQANSLDQLKSEYDLEVVNLFDQKRIRISEIKREYHLQEVCKSGLFGSKTTTQSCNNILLGFNYTVNVGSIEAVGNTIFVTK